IIGHSLSSATINLVNKEPAGLSVTEDGDAAEDSIKFIVRSDKPVPPDTVLQFAVVNKAGTQTTAISARFMPDKPTIASIDAPKGPQGAESLKVTITGTGFIPNVTTVLVDGTGVHVAAVKVNSATSMEATLKIDASATKGKRNLSVSNPAGLSGPV